MTRALNMLGLCARAGKLVSGEKLCLQTIRAGGVYAVLIDAGASDNAVKAVSDACESHHVTLLTAPRFALGSAIGKPGRMVVGITDPGMAEQVVRLSRMN